MRYDTAADHAAALGATALALQNRFDVTPRGVIWVATAADHLLRKGMRTRMGTARLTADATSRTMHDSAAVRRTPPPSADPGTSARPTTPRPKPKSSGGGGADGYTGPRCYAPGGKTYRPC